MRRVELPGDQAGREAAVGREHLVRADHREAVAERDDDRRVDAGQLVRQHEVLRHRRRCRSRSAPLYQCTRKRFSGCGSSGPTAASAVADRRRDRRRVGELGERRQRDARVSLAVEAMLRVFSQYLQSVLPGGIAVALTVYLIFDFGVVVLLFAMIFKFLPDVKIQWRDVWFGAVITGMLFGLGKWLLGLYLGSGAAGSAYGAASSLITLLLWVYYTSQILLFGAEFTQALPHGTIANLSRTNMRFA